MRLFILAKSHRNASGAVICAACRTYKRSTSRLVVAPDSDVDGKSTVLNMCSGCSAALHRAAVEGRKVER